MKMIYRFSRVPVLRTMIFPLVVVIFIVFGIYRFAESAFWFDFLSNTLATITGIIVGIPVAIFLSEYQERESELERKYKILRLVEKELSANHDKLGNWKDSGDKQKDGLTLHAVLKTESWRAFSDGGELQWIKSPDLLGIISEAYYSIRSAQTLSERYFEVRMMSTTSALNWAEATSFSKLEEAVLIAEKTLKTTIKTINEELIKN